LNIDLFRINEKRSILPHKNSGCNLAAERPGGEEMSNFQFTKQRTALW